MNFYYAFAAWAGIGTLLGLALFQAAKGHPLYLVLAIIAFVVAVGKIGCHVEEEHHEEHKH